MDPLFLTQSSWSAAADQSGAGVWEVVAIAGPAALALLLVFLVVRAALRQGRYRAVAAFDSADREAVRQALAEAERRTVGEVLPVVLERSDPHPSAEWLAALCFVLVGSALLAAWLPWHQPALVLACQFGLGAAGFALARWLPDFKRAFIHGDRATAVVAEQALQEFHGNGLHRTEGATGVLLLVSLLERRVVVLADAGIDREVSPDYWAEVDDLVLAGIRRGSLRDGLIAGIQRVEALLAERFPCKEGDRNEIPDRVIVRRE